MINPYGEGVKGDQHHGTPADSNGHSNWPSDGLPGRGHHVACSCFSRSASIDSSGFSHPSVGQRPHAAPNLVGVVTNIV